MPLFGDPRDLDTFNDFDDPPSSNDRQSEFTVLEIEPCPMCGEPTIAEWGHLETCPHYEEMMDLPF